jgi:hypothetical protein
MAELPSPQRALLHIARLLHSLGRDYALVGGLAVSIRAEVRFTRDVDVAVAVETDADAESLIYSLRDAGYEPVATVEHETNHRLATARLAGPAGIVVALMFASCGIESEIVERAEPVALEDIGFIPVARPEELLAMKVLSMTDARLQDRLDAQNLATFNPDIDLDVVRDNLRRIAARGYQRGQDLDAKLTQALAELRDDDLH